MPDLPTPEPDNGESVRPEDIHTPLLAEIAQANHWRREAIRLMKEMEPSEVERVLGLTPSGLDRFVAQKRWTLTEAFRARHLLREPRP